MQPTGRLAKLASNPNATAIFKASKAQNKHLRKDPEWDVAVDNIAMKTILHNRNNAEILEQQEKMREEAKVNAKRNKKRIKEVRKMQEDLRLKFIESNNFICECEEKEAEISKKIAAEEEIGNKLQKDIDDMEERIKDLTDFHENTFKPAIERNSVYEDVLEKVVNESDLFKSKEDFLDRCDSLLLVQSEMAQNDEVTLKSIEDLQADIVKTSNEATLMVAGLENQMTELQKSYDKTKNELMKWENTLPPTKDAIATEEKETFMLLDQIQQLYTLLCKRHGIEPKFKREQVEEQLDYIKTEMDIIQDIIDMSHEMMALETRSDIAEHGSGRSGKPRK